MDRIADDVEVGDPKKSAMMKAEIPNDRGSDPSSSGDHGLHSAGKIGVVAQFPHEGIV